MKTFVIILLLCFADGLLARALYKNETDILVKCAAENHLDSVYLNASSYEKPLTIGTAKFINEKDLNCTLACIYKNVGLISADGTLNITPDTGKYVAQFTPEFLFECNEKAKGDSCKLAGCIKKTHDKYDNFDETKTCFTENGLDERFAEYIWKKMFGQIDAELPNSLKDLPLHLKSKLNCSYACTMMRAGLISEKGKVHVSEEERKLLKVSPEKIKSCTQQASGDACKLPVCLLNL